MTVILSLLAQLLHIILMLVAAPIAAGALDWLDARWTGRAGPPILAPCHDLIRLSRKTPMLIEDASMVSRLAPAVSLGSTLAIACLVPSFALGMALSPLADVLVIASLFAIGRVALALAALDSGAALPGLRQQDASALAVLAEPALLLVVFALALMGGSFNLDLIISQQREGLLLPAAASALALASLLAVALADTHPLDRSVEALFGGIDLAMVRVTGWLRRLIWIDLIGALFIPIGIAPIGIAPIGLGNPANGPSAWLIGMAAWAVKLIAFLLALSVVQMMLGRIPRHSLPDLVGVAALLALLAVIMVLALTGTA